MTMSEQTRRRIFHVFWGAALFVLTLASSRVTALTSAGADVADIGPEWTREGRQAAVRLAALPPKDEMGPVSEGPFLLGSNRQVDRNASSQERTQRPVYVDVYESGKYERAAAHYTRSA